MAKRVVDVLEVVLVDQDHAHIVAVAAKDLPGPGGVGVAAQQPGERVLLRGGQAPVQGDGVDGPAGHRDGGGGQ
ncbi:hypothetical protein GCM10009574_088330 [Streptomyces asiaticus]|uniref:Uncharacterized protein n=2 Tax=Streptomyces rhizosphaericus TaxID=114699 RepID=A0ABN1SMF1_9ACTN